MDSRSEMQVKIDFVRKAYEVLNCKGHKIAQLTQKVCSFHFLNQYFWAFKQKKL